MTQANITDTGLRGYFKWLLQDQPGLAVRVIAAVSQQIPSAFSDYDQSQALGRLRGLADDDSDDSDDSDVLDTSLFDGSDTGFDTSLSLTDTGGGILDPSTSLDQALPVASSIADTANSSAVNPSVTSSVSSILGSTLSALGVPLSTADAINQMSAQQLQNAQAGLPPTNLSSAASGIPQAVSNIATSLGGTTGILIIGGVLVLAGLLLASGSGRSSSGPAQR